MRRKLAAIVAADIVGYSRRFSEDESGTLAAIGLLRTHIIEPHLARHSGRIFRLLGDSTLIEFESALGAVEFATEVQQNLAARNAREPENDAILLRMGLDLGDVIFEDNEIHGEGINIAVRLEEIAEPGGICLSDSIHAQIRKRLDRPFLPIGPRMLKNIAEPVQVWLWRPEPVGRSAYTGGASAASRHKQIDPQVTELILRLHARSAQLGISNALDDMLAENDQIQRLKTEVISERIGEQLLLARSMLDRIHIEPVEEFREYAPEGRAFPSLSEFVASLFQDHRNGYLLRLLPEAQAIMRGNEGVIAKRRRFLDMVRRFHDEEFVVRSKSLIKSAFVD